MKMFYEILTLMVAILIFPVLYFHSRGKRRLRERYGLWQNYPECQVVWFHGASIGEVQGLVPLMQAYRQRFPESFLLLTATSPTGLDAGEGVADEVHLLPFDHHLFLAPVLARLDVKEFLFGETELWPTLLSLLAQRKVPVHLVNGVISDKSFLWYRRMRSLFAGALQNVKTLSISDNASSERFIELGASTEIVRVTGNSKYDRPPSVCSSEEALRMRQEYFQDQDCPVVTLGSIHPGEITYWFPVIKKLLLENKPVLFIIAPRHREKFVSFREELKSFDIRYRAYSESQKDAADASRVCLLDTYGELESVYSFSDIAFVGGTLVKIGGHNPFEPASYGALPVVGPFVSKISALVEELQERDALRRVACVEDITKLLDDLILHRERVRAQGARAREVWEKHQGATDRIFSHIGL